MKTIVAVLCFMVASAPVLAQDKSTDVEKKTASAAESKKTRAAVKEPTDKQRAQQARMKDCATRAEGRKGGERNAFMSSCLKASATSTTTAAKTPATTAQQHKMKSCNTQAADKQLKGVGRKTFMKDCLAT